METEEAKQPEEWTEVTPEVAAEAATEAAAENQDTAEADEKTDKKPAKKKRLSKKEIIAQLEEKVTEAEDKTLRLQAEFQNYRKRISKDLATARLNSLTDTVAPFLQVFDHFSMAMKASESTDNVESLVLGLNMILGEFQKAMDELGVTKFDAIGQKFNPELHNAVANEPSDEIEEGMIIKQWLSGYKLGERLLRPATVVVSSGPVKVAEQSEEPAEEAEEK
jgi:molecular chaperone GrpE